MYSVHVFSNPHLLTACVSGFVLSHSRVIPTTTISCNYWMNPRVGVLPRTDHVTGVIHLTCPKCRVHHVCTVPQHRLTVKFGNELQPRDTWSKIECRPNSIVSRNRVTLEFSCHPKSSVTGFQLQHVMHWHSNSTDALHQLLLSSQCHPTLGLHTVVHCKLKIQTLTVFQALNTRTPGNEQQIAGILHIQEVWIHVWRFVVQSYMADFA